jgi:hypothetical protein
MKPCPQCGAPLHLVVNRWTHVTPSRCLLITLQASPEEIAQHYVAPKLSGAQQRKASPSPLGPSKFGYLAPGAEGAAD